METLLLFSAIGLFALSIYFRLRYIKYKDSGKIPHINAARSRFTLCFTLGMATSLLFVAAEFI